MDDIINEKKRKCYYCKSTLCGWNWDICKYQNKKFKSLEKNDYIVHQQQIIIKQMQTELSREVNFLKEINSDFINFDNYSSYMYFEPHNKPIFKCNCAYHNRFMTTIHDY